MTWKGNAISYNITRAQIKVRKLGLTRLILPRDVQITVYRGMSVIITVGVTAKPLPFTWI